MELIPYKERIEGYTRKRLSILNQWRYFNHFEIPMYERLVTSWSFYYKDVFDEDGNVREVLVINHGDTITNFLLMVLLSPFIFLLKGLRGCVEFWQDIGSKKDGYYFHDYHYLELDDFMGYGKESYTWLHNLFLKTNLKTLKRNEEDYVPKD